MEVISIIAQTLKISEDKVTDDLSYQSISEWDSLNHVALMLALERYLGTEIDGNLLIKLTSVAAIKEYFQSFMVKAEVAPSQEFIDETSEEIDNKKSNIQSQLLCNNNASICRGLNNIVFDNTTIAHIDGNRGILSYRGYSIDDLVNFSHFEEVVYLLIYKELPTQAQLEDFCAQLETFRILPEPVTDFICSVPEADPVTVLRTAISMLAMFDKDRMDNTYEGTRRKGIRLIAQLPTIVAMHHRFRKSLPYVQSSSTFSHVANVLYLLQDAKPSAKHEKIVDRNLMLHAEHSSNASSFTARVVSGTQADIHAAITSAIAAFSGPLHGGAIEHTMKMLREIGEPELASAYIKARIERKEPIMGFGHRVYRTDDPRAKHLRQSIQELSHELQDYKWLAILDEVVAAMQPYSRHGIHVNVDFYACVIYHLLGLPEDLFVPLFVLGRIAGWVAHVLEQWENNILIRPIMQYTGRESRPYVPMVGRKSL